MTKSIVRDIFAGRDLTSRRMVMGVKVWRMCTNNPNIENSLMGVAKIRGGRAKQ